MNFAQFAYNSDEESPAGPIDLITPEKVEKVEKVVPIFSSKGLKRKFVSEGNEASHPPASSAKGMKECYKSPGQPKESILKLIIVGHNPSHQSYSKGHFYANPANRMWPILRKVGLVNSSFTAANDQDCPEKHSIGFTDLMFNICETDSSAFSDREVASHKDSLYLRLMAHVTRVSEENTGLTAEDCYPRIIAFAGVRQFKALFPENHPIHKAAVGANRQNRRSKEVSTNEGQKGIVSTLDSFLVNKSSGAVRKQAVKSSALELSYGLQSLRPVDWPGLLSKSLIFLLPSTSGAAAMTTEQRENPFYELAELMQTIKVDDDTNQIQHVEVNSSRSSSEESPRTIIKKKTEAVDLTLSP